MPLLCHYYAITMPLLAYFMIVSKNQMENNFNYYFLKDKCLLIKKDVL